MYTYLPIHISQSPIVSTLACHRHRNHVCLSRPSPGYLPSNPPGNSDGPTHPDKFMWDLAILSSDIGSLPPPPSLVPAPSPSRPQRPHFPSPPAPFAPPLPPCPPPVLLPPPCPLLALLFRSPALWAREPKPLVAVLLEGLRCARTGGVSISRVPPIERSVWFCVWGFRNGSVTWR